MPCLLLLALVVDAAAPTASPAEHPRDVVEVVAALDAGRRALNELDYERAVLELTRVVDDERVEPRVRARAWMLLGEARFGIARGDFERDARDALAHALRLDDNIDFDARADVSPRLLAMFDAMRASQGKQTNAGMGAAASTSSRSSTSSASSNVSHADANASAPSESSTAHSEAGASALSPWWIASAGLATTSLLAVGGAIAVDAYLGNLPADASTDDIDALQATGVAVVVVAIASGAAALVTSATALLVE